MDKIYNIYQINSFLFDAKVIHLSVVENNKAKSCPIEMHMYYDQKLMFAIGTDNPLYHSMKKNPYICLSAYRHDRKWFRYTGKAVFEDDDRYSKMMIRRCPTLTKYYNDTTGFQLMIFHLEDSTSYIIDEFNNTFRTSI